MKNACLQAGVFLDDAPFSDVQAVHVAIEHVSQFSEQISR
jgi:hypothetical protein